MEKIRTALCSFGMSGWMFHAPFISEHEGFGLYAVLERTKDLAAAKYPGIKTFRSLVDLLGDDAIELVIVNTPNSTHFEFAKKALLAGKHVIIEKPFTNTVADAKELIGIAGQNNRLLSVYHNRRWDSDFKTVKKILDEKLLGTVAEAEIHFDRYREKLSDKAHKEMPGPGSGILYDLGSHLVDQALQLFGTPDAVFADILSLRTNSRVPDYFELILFYEQLRVRLKAGYLVREAIPAYIIHGSKGSFIKPRADVQEDALREEIPVSTVTWGIEPGDYRGILHTEIDGEVSRILVDSEKGNYMEYYDAIFHAIRNKGPLPVTASEAMQVIRVIEAAYQSAAEKRIIQF